MIWSSIPTRLIMISMLLLFEPSWSSDEPPWSWFEGWDAIYYSGFIRDLYKKQDLVNICMYYGLLFLLLHFSNSRVMFPDRVESKNCKHCLFSRKSPLSFPTTTYCILLNGLYFYWVTLINYTKINAGTIHGMNTREMEFICKWLGP